MEIESYSAKAFVVRGATTKDHKETLKELGGRWNKGLTSGPGWIFSETRRSDVEAFLKSIEQGPITSMPLQTLWYTVENPLGKIKVLLTRSTETEEVAIANMDIVNNKVHRVYLQDGKEIVVVNGKWQVWGQDYSVEFK